MEAREVGREIGDVRGERDFGGHGAGEMGGETLLVGC